jgi:putative FmdB family regulatory protein
MPIYEYLCAGCSGTFEELVRAEQDAVSCPDCGGSRVTKLLSSFATRKPVMAGGGGGGGGCCGGSCGCGH